VAKCLERAPPWTAYIPELVVGSIDPPAEVRPHGENGARRRRNPYLPNGPFLKVNAISMSRTCKDRGNAHAQ